MISRNTFYLHYSDKYDLLNKICDNLMRTLFFRAGKQLRRVQQNDFTLESIADVIKYSILAIEKDREEYEILFSIAGVSDILTNKINHISKCFLGWIKDDIGAISELSMSYIVAGIAGVIRYYVINGVDNIDKECLNFTKIHLAEIVKIGQEAHKR